jgi:hypothetical protein
MREFMGEGEGLEFVKSRLPQPEPVARPPLGRQDTRPDDDYFDNPPELIN